MLGYKRRNLSYWKPTSVESLGFRFMPGFMSQVRQLYVLYMVDVQWIFDLEIQVVLNKNVLFVQRFYRKKSFVVDFCLYCVLWGIDGL